MILSIEDLFSNKQAVTATAVSTNTIDLGKAGSRDLGHGNKVPLLVQVVESFAGLTDLTVELQTANDEAFASAVTLASQKFATAKLKAGARLLMTVVPNGAAGRFLRLRYVVSGTATAGKITAGLSMGNDETAPF
ncbi:MAG: Bbp16 family capsid cement protein [Saezia sp.]